jgi:SmpA / OmlA family
VKRIHDRRRQLLLALPVVLVLLGVGAWIVADANARAIRPGMTEEQVDAIIGSPNITFGEGHEAIYGDGTVVCYSHDGTVMSVTSPNMLDRLRRRLGW